MRSARRRRPIEPHVCPAAPNGEYRPVTLAGLRRAGLLDEAGNLESVVADRARWGAPALSESGLAMGIFGCCRWAELGKAIEEAEALARPS